MRTKITALVISVIMILCTFVGCSNESIEMHTYEAVVNSEPFKLTYPVYEEGKAAKTEEEMAEIDKACAKAIADALFIFSKENSAGIGEINKEVDAVFDCSDKLVELLNYTYSVSSMTGGRYQPVLGAVTELYKSGEEITDEVLSNAMSHTGLELVSVEGNTIRKSDRLAKLDYNSISAGYALADAAAVLSIKGVDYAVLTYMNTVVTYGEPDKNEMIDVAVYTGKSEDSYHGVVSFNNAVLSTCNGDRLVVDIKTGKKVESVHDTVVVICNDGILSNALATVLYGMSVDEIQKMYNSKVIKFEAVMIEKNGEVHTTSEYALYKVNEESNKE